MFTTDHEFVMPPHPEHIFAKGVTIRSIDNETGIVLIDNATGHPIAGVQHQHVSIDYTSSTIKVEFDVKVSNVQCEIHIYANTMLYRMLVIPGIEPETREQRLIKYIDHLETELAEANTNLEGEFGHAHPHIEDQVAMIRGERTEHGLLDGDLA